MKIFIYDSLSKQKKEFVPIDAKKIRIYACGPTVYNYAHIGNARMSVVTDLLVNVLKTKFKKVVFVSNITDVDDKIIEASIREKKPIKEITTKYHEIYNEDMKMIGVSKPDLQPKATEHIQEMIEMINKLLKNDCAYIEDNHVLFDVSKYEHYGCLSKRTKEEQIAGNRIDVGEYKKNSEDFILWKPSKQNEPGWDSPWGFGRPGWHLECSAMSEKCLGIPFDIHGGGRDLIFPHHENEIAQSCCANKNDHFANYWVHNGFVTFDKEKMSKSLGNIVTIAKLRENINGQVVRLALLSAHYKQPLDWNEKLIQDSQNTLDKWYSQFEKDDSEEINEDLLKPLLEDLNTPEYISKLHKLYDESSKGNKSSKSKFLAACKLIGLLEEDKQSWKNFKKSKAKVDEIFISKKIKDRNTAREKGDYKLADVIRKELEDNGVLIEDKQDKTIWKYK